MEPFRPDSVVSLKNRTVISVCCASSPSEEELRLAYEVGKEIARQGAVLVCGGLGGSMEACCRGAKEAGGITIGILPSYDKSSANQWVDIAVPTGLGHARNNLVVAAGDGVIGVGGGWGTLSELAIAMKMGKPVAVLKGWSVSAGGSDFQEFAKAATPEEAVALVMAERKR